MPAIAVPRRHGWAETASHLLSIVRQPHEGDYAIGSIMSIRAGLSLANALGDADLREDLLASYESEKLFGRVPSDAAVHREITALRRAASRPRR